LSTKDYGEAEEFFNDAIENDQNNVSFR
jgi:tetratricopeptide (TPR) repeat protein